MVTTSPVKPSSARMLRLKKEQTESTSLQNEGGKNTDAVSTEKNDCSMLIPKSAKIMNHMSSSILSRLSSCSGRGTPNTAAASSSESSEELLVEIVNDDESESVQTVLSPGSAASGRASFGGGTCNNDNVTIASCSGGGAGRMSQLFQKRGGGDESGSKNGGDNANDNARDGSDKEDSGNSQNNSKSSDDEGGKDDKTTNNNFNEEQKEDDTTKDDDEEDSQKHRTLSSPTCPSSTPLFNTSRIEFAQASTLPIHNGTESTAPKSHPSWTPVDGTEFKVRTGPNYTKNGKKIASASSLYEVYAVRFFRSEKRTVGGATRIMPLPEMSIGVDTRNKSHLELKGTKIPDVLVVHFMLPFEPPNVFKQKDDGKGGECVYYLRPSQRFLDEIAGKIPETPATRLFVKWCNHCESDFKMRSRFKCMALVRDIEKHNMGLLKSYNGKPVLITESGRACSGYHGDTRYLEMTANVHYWAFVAKKGFVSLIPKFQCMQMEVGFTIEAHEDSEMPECMLGSTVLSYIGDKTGPMIEEEMQEPVHQHQS